MRVLCVVASGSSERMYLSPVTYGCRQGLDKAQIYSKQLLYPFSADMSDGAGLPVHLTPVSIRKIYATDCETIHTRRSLTSYVDYQFQLALWLPVTQKP